MYILISEAEGSLSQSGQKYFLQLGIIYSQKMISKQKNVFVIVFVIVFAASHLEMFILAYAIMFLGGFSGGKM